MIGATESDRAAVSSEGKKSDPGLASGLNMNAARLRPGAISDWPPPTRLFNEPS
jgi:hypothetical protein